MRVAHEGPLMQPINPMLDLWIKPNGVFDGSKLHQCAYIRVRSNMVIDIACKPVNAVVGQISGIVTPGFVDLQVNGGGGVLVNDAPTPERLSKIAKAHRATGTVGIMPTVITDAPDVLAAAADAVLKCKDPSILGLHIEGPHIAKSKRGTHAEEHIRPYDVQTLNIVSRLNDAGKAVIVTLAPEVVAPDDIRALRAAGALVSLGHTDANAEQMHAGFEAGAHMVTHLFNAMSPMSHRAPGAVGAALSADVTIGMICDGHHVDDAVLALAIRGMAGRPMLVSDAMPSVGGAGDFKLYGQVISLKEGRLINAAGNLAGAHSTMGSGASRLVRTLKLPVEKALQMTVTTPAATIRRTDLHALIGRSIDDVFVLSKDLAFKSTLQDAFTG